MAPHRGIVLGLETSCDETAAAVVRDGREVLSNVVRSQVAAHRPHGGVVPEIAARRHVEALPEVLAEAVRRAGIRWDEIAMVAATRGPGLAGALLAGWSAAKGLALRLGRPLCAVHHLEAHFASVFLNPATPPLEQCLPLATLIVSGGHTSLFVSESADAWRPLGRTIDDAAGEALDKGAKLLGLAYPGGPEIERLARGADSPTASFPEGRVREHSAALDGLEPSCCFSFSGLKTALQRRVLSAPDMDSTARAKLAADYQESVCEALVRRCDRALDLARCLAVGGGVSVNARLRERLAALCDRRGARLLLALPEHCGDNAAMVAAAAAMGRGVRDPAARALDIDPNWPMDPREPSEMPCRST